MLTEHEIMYHLQKYLDTPDGKALLAQHGIKNYKRGLNVASPEMLAEMEAAGEEMADILFDYIKPVIKSFERDAILVSKPYMKNNQYTIDISFDPAKVHRKSLYPEGYPAGLDNIVRLFSTGVHASNFVHGIWEGHTTEPIYSRPVRNSNKFMSRAVTEFNSRHQGTAVARLDATYKHK